MPIARRRGLVGARFGALSGLFAAAAALTLAIPFGACADAPPPANPQGPVRPGAEDKQLGTLLQDAQRALAAGNLQLALIQLKNAVRSAPDNGEIRAKLGAVLMASGDAVSAERELRQALSDGASKQAALPALFQAMLSSREYKELLAEFPDPGDARDATTPDVLRARAIAEQALGQDADANASMDRALAIRRDVPGLLVRSQIAQHEGAYDLASSLVDEALTVAPKDPEALLLRAQLLQRAGHSNEALADVDQIIALHPQSIAAHAERIGILLDAQQNDKAKADVDALLARIPQMPLATYYKAILQSRDHDTAGAWAIAQTLPPDFVTSRAEIGTAVAQMAIAAHSLESAEATLKAVLARDPAATDTEHERARLILAALKLQQNKTTEAFALLDPLKETHDAQALELLAEASLQARKFDDAIGYFEKANTETGGSNELLRQELAVTEMQSGKTDEAIQQLSEAVARDPARHDLAGLLVAALARAGRFDEANAAIDRMQKQPDQAGLPAFYHGEVQEQRGDLGDAVKWFTEALRQDPKFLPALFYRAEVEAKQGRLDAASDDLTALLKQNPDNLSALLKQAEIAARQDKGAEVKAILQKAGAVAPQDTRPGLALANYQMLSGDNDGAVATLNGVFKLSPDNPEGLNLLGKIQLAKGSKDAAIATYEHLAAKLPDSAMPQMLLAQVLATTGDQAGAKAAVQTALKLAPAYLPARQALIGIEAKAGDRDGAIHLAEEYRSGHPGPDADRLLAFALVSANRIDAAKATLKASLAAKSDDGVAIELSEIDAKSGDLAGAEKLLADFVQREPKDNTILSAYAALLLMNDKKGAEKAYEDLLTRQPDNPVVLNNLGWLLMKENPGRASELVARAAEIAPRSAAIVDTLGWMKFKAGDQQDALPLLQRAHQLQATDPAISYHLAAVLDKAGNQKEARSLLQIALAGNASFDGSDDARQLQAQLK